MAAPASAAAPRLQARAGWNGLAQRGRWAPVHVTVANVAEPTEGVLELQVASPRRPPLFPGAATEQLEASITATPASLAPGSTRRYTLYTIVGSPGWSPSRLTVTARLRTEGKVLATATAPLRALDPGSRLILTVTGESAGLQVWDAAARQAVGWAGGGDASVDPTFLNPIVRTVHAKAEELPERWNGYDSVDLAVITGKAWEGMGPRQRRVLRLWVEGGGRAILCGEQAQSWADPEGRRLVPGQLRSVSYPVEMLPAKLAPVGISRDAAGSDDGLFAQRGFRGTRASGAKIAAAPLTPRADTEPFLRVGSDVLGCAARVGFGVVVWLGLDPFRESVRQSPANRPLWRSVLAHASGTTTDAPRLGNLVNSRTADRLASTLPRLPAPSRGLLIGIGLAYVFLFGPVNIRILRRLGRGVTAWLFLPALSLAMTLLLLAVGRSWGQSRALLNRVTVIEAMSGAAAAWEQGYNGLFSPTNARYTVELYDPATTLSARGQRETVYRTAVPIGASPALTQAPSIAREGRLPTLQLEESARWERLSLPLWSLQYQQYERLTDLGGAVTIALRGRPGQRPAGFVQNETPHRLADTYLQLEGHRLALGDLEPGAKRAVSPNGWVRRRAARGGALFAGASPSTAAQGSGDEPTLHEEAPILLSPGARGREALLVCRAPGVETSLRVSGVAVRPRETLLLVRGHVIGR